MRATLRFEALDSWRGLCALWVVLYHFRAVSHVYDWLWVRTGDIAVDFFFVLSGFVLTHAYGNELESNSARWRFLIRRFGRLYPLHFVTLVAVLCLECARWAAETTLNAPLGRPAFTGDTTPWALPANFLLIHALGLFRDFTWNIPSWSISVEWILCLTFAALSFARKSQLYSLLLAATGFIITLWMSSLSWYPPEGYTALVRGIYGFFLGSLVYEIFSFIRDRDISIPGWIEWLAPPILTLAVLSKDWQMPAITPLLFGLLVFIFAAESGAISHTLKKSALSYLGKISYSIYLIHYVLVLVAFGVASLIGKMASISAVVSRGIFGASVINMPNLWIGDLSAVAFLCLTIIAASFSYHWIEEPGRKWFNRLSKHVPED